LAHLRLQAVGRSPLEEGLFTEGEHVGITIGFHVAHVLAQEEMYRGGAAHDLSSR
jgi:hypothetical protein